MVHSSTYNNRTGHRVYEQLCHIKRIWFNQNPCPSSFHERTSVAECEAVKRSNFQKGSDPSIKKLQDKILLIILRIVFHCFILSSSSGVGTYFVYGLNFSSEAHTHGNEQNQWPTPPLRTQYQSVNTPGRAQVFPQIGQVSSIVVTRFSRSRR